MNRSDWLALAGAYRREWRKHLSHGMDSVYSVAYYFDIRPSDDRYADAINDMALITGKMYFGASFDEALKFCADVRSMYHLALNSRLRSVWSPVLNAPFDVLSVLGIHLRARNTAALADALKNFYI